MIVKCATCGHRRTWRIPHTDSRKCGRCYAIFHDPRVHKVGDGRGGRIVYLDGKRMHAVTYALEGKRGVVKVHVIGLGGMLEEVTLRGEVTVVPQLPEKENGGS